MTQEKLLQFIEQNEKLMQEVTELRKVVKQQDNHLRAYKLKIEELEKELKGVGTEFGPYRAVSTFV